jgi:iron complex outermembrane receptor protein
MKSSPSLFVVRLLSILCLLFTPIALTAQGGSGAIEGRIFNAATGAALANARVVIEGTTREALTDESGGYRLTGLPAGATRLSISYLGFDRQSATVNVPATGVVQRDVEMSPTGAARATGDTVKLTEFTVVADREMSAQAIAMNEQRYAPNIKNVVAIDEYGDRGDENIGEFLRFLPGVALNDSGSVPNEVTLRGFPASTSGVTIDGGDVMGARGGDTRALSLLEVPMSNVSRVEVTKVPTPDMPASGLGGSLNIISKGGFESRKPVFSYQIYQLFHDRSGLTLDGGPRNHVDDLSPKYVQPSFNFSYLHPVNKSLAFTFGGSRTWRQKPMERGDDSDETATWNLVDGILRTSDWQSLAQILKTWSVQAGADWRITARDTLSASFQYRESDSYITRSIFSANYGVGATGNATFVQGASTGVGSVSQGDGANQDILTQTTQFGLKYRHRGDVWKFDAATNWSVAESQWEDIKRGHFNTAPSSIANLILRGDGIPSQSGIIPTRYTALSRTGAPVDIFDGGNYAITSGNSLQNDYNAEKISGRADVTRDFTWTVPVTLKTGVFVDRMERDNRRFLKTWNFRPNGQSDVASRMAGAYDVFDQAYNADAPSIYGRPMRWISTTKLYQLLLQRPEWFAYDEPLAHQNLVANSRRLIETISAAYLRSDVRLLKNRLWLVAGARFEKTEDEGWGPSNDPSAQYQKDANGRVIDGNPTTAGVQPIFLSSDLLVRARQRYVERGTHAKRDYDGLYPSLNASYSVSDNLVLRAAYARTIGRPNVTAVVPSATFTEPTVAAPTITVTNPGLKPWTADSYDFTVESYHLKDGFGSVGVFQKDIKNFFGSVRSAATADLLDQYGLPDDPAYLAYEIATTTNIGDAKITGFEFTYRQSLTFLPQWARGFQVFVNGTKMSLSGSTTADFTGFNPSAYSGGINFIRSRYFIKLTCTHQGETRRGAVAANVANGIPAGTFNYQDARTRWSISAQYSLTKRFAIYGSVSDFDGGFSPSTLRYGPGTPDYAKPQRYQELGYYSTIGVKGSF